MNSNREIEWINFAKFIAIVAVIFDHSYGVLYFNERVRILSYFSVSLFVLISGMLSYRSIIKHQLSWFKTFWRSSKRIILAYLVSTMVYYVWVNRFFDLYQYIQLISNFNISGPFYYVALYIQLMLISKPLFNIIDKIPMTKKGIIIEVIFGFLLLYISHCSIFYSNILYLYGGAGKLLGGTYLFLYYLGMICSKHDVFSVDKDTKINLITIIFGLLLILWIGYVYNKQFFIEESFVELFGEGKNPPGVTIIVMAVLVLFFVYGLYNFLRRVHIFVPFMKGTNYIGKHTLYIFLYHRFFLDYIFPSYLAINGLWIKRLIYIVGMILAPICVEYMFKGICLLFKEKDFKIEE